MYTVRHETPQEIFPDNPESVQILQGLIDTQPEVIIQYPERPQTALKEAQPPFAAKGIALQDTEARQRGLAVFEDSTRFGSDTELIVTGAQGGQQQTLVLRRHMSRGEGPKYTTVQSFAFAGSAASRQPRAEGFQFFTAKSATLSPDGQSLQFVRQNAEPGDMTSFDMDGMYLVPTVRPEYNPDQVRGARLGRLFPRLSSAVRRQVFLR